jgi:hypothetical protein
MVASLESRLGTLERKIREDWYSSKNGAVEVFVTDSKADYGKRPWFDMLGKDLKELSRHANGFVIFILGDVSNYLVIPAKILQEELRNHTTGPTINGFYHFNLSKIGDAFKQLPELKLAQFKEKIDLLPTC